MCKNIFFGKHVYLHKIFLNCFRLCLNFFSLYCSILIIQRTPADHRWDETPGHKGNETPGATPGQSTRVWDATPGATTPGRETPAHDKSASRRNRWDETPKTERETPGHSSGWAETPRTDRTGTDLIQETPTPGASKRRYCC